MTQQTRQHFLASTLNQAHIAAKQGFLHSSQLKRKEREALIQSGWLQKIIKGWYLLSQPSAEKGQSTAWYATYWNFVRFYLNKRFGQDYCLSASDSLDLLLGNTIIPRQLLVMTKKGGSFMLKLPHQTSILIYEEKNSFPEKLDTFQNIQVMTLSVALCRVPEKYFQQQPQQAELALKYVSTEDLAYTLLGGKYLKAAERIIGAYQFLGLHDIAERLKKDMNSAGYQIQAVLNPFKIDTPLLASTRIQSPYAARILLLWQDMRKTVLTAFPASPGLPKNTSAYFETLDHLYVQDAYHSLSIEGYQVTESLIQKIAEGKWQPEHLQSDREHLNALAARGYYEAFLEVKKSIQKIFDGNIPGEIIKKELHDWYRALFSSSIKAGIIEPQHLAGYRQQAVFICGSSHVPLPKDAVIDAMESFFDCLIHEKEAAVRAVLGHFLFVFIHPYMDGNGRTGRFLMNAMLASGGYPWLIIPVEQRSIYMSTLEKASVEKDIMPFVQFLNSLLNS